MLGTSLVRAVFTQRVRPFRQWLVMFGSGARTGIAPIITGKPRRPAAESTATRGGRRIV